MSNLFKYYRNDDHDIQNKENGIKLKFENGTGLIDNESSLDK